jgi:hypothetical protein
MKAAHRRILILGIVHAAVVHPWAFVLAKWGPNHPQSYSGLILCGSFIALIFAQVALVALWAGLGRARWWIRLPVVGVGIGYLGTVLGLGVRELTVETYTITVLAGCLMWAVALVVRTFRARLVLAEAVGHPGPEGLQFTIRHLFLLTFLVACLTAGGKAAAPHFRGAGVLVIIVLLGVSFAAVGLAGMWAMLGERRPWLRCVVAILVAAGFGLLPELLQPQPRCVWVYILVTEAIWLLLSLYVVRRCGYRLVPVRRLGS